MQSVRTDLIRILTQISNEKSLPVIFDETATLAEIRLVSDLIDRHYLDGGHTENERGVPCAAGVTGITIAGREYLESLESDQFAKSTKGRLAVGLKYAAVFVAGILGTLFTQWLAKRLGLN
jgi:hypothetical protein